MSKRLNSPGYKYTRTTNASRRAAMLAKPVRGHISVGFMLVNHIDALGVVSQTWEYDRVQSRGTK